MGANDLGNKTDHILFGKLEETNNQIANVDIYLSFLSLLILWLASPMREFPVYFSKRTNLDAYKHTRNLQNAMYNVYTKVSLTKLLHQYSLPVGLVELR